MAFSGALRLSEILRKFRWSISITWLLVLLENMLLALVPLLIGLAIDGLLADRLEELWLVAGALAVLTLVGVMRRVYDTRIYSAIRIAVCATLDRRHRRQPVSTRNARLAMVRELVDFLEEELPEILTAVVQILVALVVLSLFSIHLGAAAMAFTVGIVATYGFFQRRFFRLNAALNGQVERQVDILSRPGATGLRQHLRALKSCEVRLSDAEAFVYGLIFLLAIGFIVYNLWFSAQLPTITTGKIFAIISYSWEYIEAAIVLPIALQQWARLHEITERINRREPAAGGAVSQ
ncbi:hypothetical protein FKG94_15860 [Exilibacterium tricleocarpae]|uniref:ABC transmembrane type-1 domain-containing protein n=1 Tax=Exilibacterium tricleocarpae TaxID=2591008 RepID=A0A545TBA1_9GAMM|nr:ABC transporter six-transmembrane domain-containing protein [Exilibacterium tricleocarpae]TQV74492.1 hypothetical protein FKG94_15860 [Exilibacterium tricleocarpae]